MSDTSEKLNRVVDWHVHYGFRIQSQSDRRVNLVRPKHFSFGWALAWFLLFGIGILVYIFYFMAKRDESVILTAEEGGLVSRVPNYFEWERRMIEDYIGEDPLTARQVGGQSWQEYSTRFGQFSRAEKITEWSRLGPSQRRMLTDVFGYRDPNTLEE